VFLAVDKLPHSILLFVHMIMGIIFAIVVVFKDECLFMLAVCWSSVVRNVDCLRKKFIKRDCFQRVSFLPLLLMLHSCDKLFYHCPFHSFILQCKHPVLYRRNPLLMGHHLHIPFIYSKISRKSNLTIDVTITRKMPGAENVYRPNIWQ